MKKDLNKHVLNADELLSAEMNEIEGGAESSCTTCAYLCYSSMF